MATLSAAARRRTALLVGLAYAAFISLGLPDGLNSVAWPSIRGTFELPLDALGALITTATIGYLASSFSSGRILSRMGVGTLLAASCFATAISLLGYGLAPAWIVVVTLGLLAGVGAGAIDAGLNTYAAENFNARTMNWLHASFGVGSAAGPIIMTAVLSAGQPWRLGYFVVGAAQLVLASCFALTRHQWNTHHEEAQSAPVVGASMISTLRLPNAWFSIVLFFYYTGLEVVAGQWLYTFLTEARGVLPAVAGVLVSVYWGSLTVGRLFSGVIVGRMTVRALLRLCMAGAVLGPLLIWLNVAPWLTYVGVALLGLSLAPMFPSLIASTPARMGAAHSANTVGFQISGASLGGATLASGFGLVANRFGLETIGPFMVVCALCMTVLYELLERRPNVNSL